MNPTMSDMQALQDRVRGIQASPRNQSRAQYWDVIPHDRWEPALIRTLPNRAAGGKIPFVVQPALTMWSEILGFDMAAYWHDSLTFLTAQLQMKVYHAQHIDDDTYIDTSFRLLYAMLLEGTVLGVPYFFSDEGYPWIDYSSPLVQDASGLRDLEMPDFYQSGVMPTVHRFYAEMREALDDDFLIKFPDWIMGPFGVACELRGFEHFLLDLIEDPAFAQDLMRFVVEARKVWQRQCDAFLGIKRTRGLLGNDDVYCPNLSPAMYRDLVLPLEVELCEYYSGIAYWHSCGNTTKLLPDIATIPVLDLFHCGPWTDVAEACGTMGGRGVPVEICIDPFDKVQTAEPEEQRRHLEAVVAQIPDDVNCYIKVDSLEIIRDLPTELDAIQSWIRVAREVLG